MLITAGQVLTGVPGEVIQDGAVLFSEGRIEFVGPAAEVAVSEGVVRRDFPRGTVLPGLIDCHVHLAFDASADVVAALQATDDLDLLLGMASRAGDLLAAGVTTVRDLGDRGGLALRLAAAIDAGKLPGPRILSAAAPLTAPGGHCWFLGGEVSGEAQIRELVARNAGLGASVIKVMVTGGHLTPGGAGMAESQFTADDLALIVREARKHGLPVAAHAHGTQGITDAVAAGVSTIEHCTWLTDHGPEVPAGVVADIVARGIRVSPALSRNWKTFPQRFGEELTRTLLGEMARIEAAGVRLAAGTDSGVPGARFGDYVGALEVFEYVGFSPAHVIELATTAAAEAIGLTGETGRLTPGLSADLLVVAGDPLSDLQALRAVSLVVARGRAHQAAH